MIFAVVSFFTSSHISFAVVRVVISIPMCAEVIDRITCLAKLAAFVKSSILHL